MDESGSVFDSSLHKHKHANAMHDNALHITLLYSKAINALVMTLVWHKWQLHLSLVTTSN